MDLRPGASEEARLVPVEYLYFAQHVCEAYTRMGDAVRNTCCSRTCVYLLLLYLMAVVNHELEIAEGGIYGHILVYCVSIC
jgi:hypothetical protein